MTLLMKSKKFTIVSIKDYNYSEKEVNIDIFEY